MTPPSPATRASTRGCRRAAAPPAGPVPGERAPLSGRFTTPGRGAHAPQGPNGPASYDLSSAQLLRPSKRPPQTGWRRALFVGSGGLVNPGESAGDAARRELIARVNQPLHGCYKIAMLSLKGGVGKTTMTTTLGSTFASLRGDRVIAVDANPDRGTLSQKIPLETTATVRHLLRDANRVRRYSDVRAYTSQGPSRLEVLASEQDPAVSEAFSEVDYRRTVTLLEHFYNVVLTDCGTGLMHSAMKGVLDVADSLLIVSSASIDGARSASATLDWLDAHGYRDLVSRSVAVINYVRRSSGNVDLDRVVRPLRGALPGRGAAAVRPAPRGGRRDRAGQARLAHAGGAARARGHRRRRLRPGRVPGAAPDDPPIEGPPQTPRGAPRRTGTPLAEVVLGGGRVLALGALDPLVERAQELRVVVRCDGALRATRRGLAGGAGRCVLDHAAGTAVVSGLGRLGGHHLPQQRPHDDQDKHGHEERDHSDASCIFDVTGRGCSTDRASTTLPVGPEVRVTCARWTSGDGRVPGTSGCRVTGRPARSDEADPHRRRRGAADRRPSGRRSCRIG